MAKGNSVICLNFMSSLTTIELLQFNARQGKFLRLDSEEFMLDPATREGLDDAIQLKNTIKRLYDRNKILLKSATCVVVPSFFTRQYAIPSQTPDDEIKTILISEAERFYVFKKIDPDVAYIPIQSGEMLYTAYPKSPLDDLKQVLRDLKIPIMCIECNYTATLRGLVAMGIVQEELSKQLKWGMVVLNDYNAFMVMMDGSRIEKTIENPLPIEVSDEAGLINEIRNDFSQFFGFEVLNRIVLINNSVKLSSPNIVEAINYQGQLDVFDQNERTLATRHAPEAPFPCSLEAVGGSVINIVRDISPLNLLNSTLEREQQMASEKEGLLANPQELVAYALIALGLLIFVGQMGLGAMLGSMQQGEQQKAAKLQADINTSLNSLAVVPEVKQKLYVKQGHDQNIRFNNILIKAGQALPPDAWLDELVLVSNPDLKSLMVNIRGGAMSSDPLNTYVKEVNSEVGTPGLTPSVLPKQQDNQRYFEYVLSNSGSADGASQFGNTPAGGP